MPIRSILPTVTGAVLLLTGCSSGAAAPAAPSATAPATLTTSSNATPSATKTTATTRSSSPGTGSGPSAGGATGCPAGGGTVPQGAATGATADLDHDGGPDELWISDGSDGQRLLGVRTASGAVFSTAFSSASPIGASAIGQQLDASTSIVLLSDGRQVPVYAVVDCQLIATQNAQNAQYTFDLGFTGYGSGVTCIPREAGATDGDLALYGLLVRGGDVEGDVPSIERTRVDLTDGGRRASNGPTQVAVPAEQVNDQQVQAARQVRCGNQGPQQAVSENGS